MNESPLVSIITPSYNQAEFLEQTIRSVLAQDYANIEYIVVDGGSTDGSVEVIKRYDARIAKWVSEPDEGQSDAINKGFRIATGEIVAWLNSDDVYFPDAVSTAVRRFQQRPSLGLLYGDCVFVDRDGQFLRYFTEVEPYSEFRLRNCTDFIMQPTTFFKRETLLDVGLLDASLHYSMDWDLWCRFAESGCGVHYEPKPLAATRIYPETKTMAGSRPRLREIWRVLKRHRTGLWPHAYFGFFATEVRRMLEQRETFSLATLPLAPLLFLLRVANARNILYDRRRRNHLYGIRRRSNLLLRNATIHIPVYRAVSELRLSLRNRYGGSEEAPQKTRVRITGQEQPPVMLEGRDTRHSFAFPIAEAVSRSNAIRIELEFERVDRSGIAAALDEVRLI